MRLCALAGDEVLVGPATARRGATVAATALDAEAAGGRPPAPPVHSVVYLEDARSFREAAASA